MKSSAASISILPRLSGRDAAHIRPSGAPVLKKKGSAEAAVAPARTSPSAKVANEYRVLFMTSSCVRGEWRLGFVSSQAEAESERRVALRKRRTYCSSAAERVPSSRSHVSAARLAGHKHA